MGFGKVVQLADIVVALCTHAKEGAKMPTATAKRLNEYLEDWLGTRAESEQRIVRLVEAGLPTKVINHLLDKGLSRVEVFDIIIPLRTWKHRKSPISRFRRKNLKEQFAQREFLPARRQLWETRNRPLSGSGRQRDASKVALHSRCFAPKPAGASSIKC